jgi:hypothetical protein
LRAQNKRPDRQQKTGSGHRTDEQMISHSHCVSLPGMPGITSELKQYGAAFALISPNLGQMRGAYNGLRAGIAESHRLISLIESRSRSRISIVSRLLHHWLGRPRYSFDGLTCDEATVEV